MTTSAFGVNADKFTMEAAVCALYSNRTYGKHTHLTHIHTSLLIRTSTHTFCLRLLPAFTLCMPTVCLAPGLRSGATHKLCALTGFYTL